jgi:Protein of unknown function (DUF742)
VNRLPEDSEALWYDDEAGPMVRAYTLTRGRTCSRAGVARMDLIAIVSAVNEPADDGGDDGDHGGGGGGRGAGGASAASRSTRSRTPVRRPVLGEEHLGLIAHCRVKRLSVAELAAEADLPLGVVRVLLGDLLDLGRVRITDPVPPAELPDADILMHVISGLKSL